MINGKILFWPWDKLNQLTDGDNIEKGWAIGLYDKILTKTGWRKVSLMIFIKKSGIMEYEVLVLKSDAKDKYIKLPQDNFTRYTETDDSVSFYFYSYFAAHKFADTILPLHTEFSDRPIGLIP